MRLLRAAGRMLAWAVVGLAAGFGAGVVSAVAGRALMRSVAILGGLEPSWNAHYSLNLLLMLGTYGSLLGLVYVVVRRFVPGTGARKGAIYGLACLVLLVYPAILQEAHVVVAEIGLAPTVFGACLISSLFVSNGMLVEAAVARLSRHLAGPARTEQPGHGSPAAPTAAGVAS